MVYVHVDAFLYILGSYALLKAGIHQATLLLQQHNKVAGNNSSHIMCHRRYRNMLPGIDRLSVPHNFVATKHQRRAACCTQQYSYNILGDLLPATVVCNKVA